MRLDGKVTIITGAGETPVARGSKSAIAGAVLDAVAGLRAGAAGTLEGA